MSLRQTTARPTTAAKETEGGAAHGTLFCALRSATRRGSATPTTTTTTTATSTTTTTSISWDGSNRVEESAARARHVLDVDVEINTLTAASTASTSIIRVGVGGSARVSQRIGLGCTSRDRGRSGRSSTSRGYTRGRCSERGVEVERVEEGVERHASSHLAWAKDGEKEEAKRVKETEE